MGASFSWTSSSSSFANESLNISVAGTFDIPNNSVSWVGGGTYRGAPLSLSGTIMWTDGSSFLATHNSAAQGQYGQASIFTGVNGDPTWDSGTSFDSYSSGIHYKIERSRSWWQYIPFTSNGAIDSVDVTVDKGTITSNKLIVHDESTKVGLSIALVGGTYQIEGGAFSKEVTVSSIPEPTSLMMYLVGIGLLGFTPTRGGFRKIGDGNKTPT